MQTYVNLWDRYFGKKVQIEVPRKDGTTVMVEVTKAWFEQAVREGKIAEVDEPEPKRQRPGQDAPRAMGASMTGEAREAAVMTSIHRALESDNVILQKSVGSQSLRPLHYWLCMAPAVMVHATFVDQGARAFPVPLLRNATVSNGTRCAAVTQGYCAFVLVQMLTNSADFRAEMDIQPDQITRLFATVFRGDAADAFAEYTAKFSVPHGMPGAIDPRDWPLVWFWDLADLLIPEQAEQARHLGEWNDNLLARTEFVSHEMQLIGHLRSTASQFVKTGTLPTD